MIAQAVGRIWVADAPSIPIVLVGRNPARLEAVAADLKARGGQVIRTQILDFENNEEVIGCVRDLDLSGGGFDRVLIAHGDLTRQAACDENSALIAHAVQVNFTSAAILSLECAKAMSRRQTRGVIAVIGSVAGDRGRQSNFVYGSAKGGLAVFLQGLRNRYDREGIQILTIKPGFVDTPMIAHIKKSLLFAAPDSVARGICRAIDQRRDVVYLPRFWGFILFVVRHLPERIFKRLRF